MSDITTRQGSAIWLIFKAVTDDLRYLLLILSALAESDQDFFHHAWIVLDDRKPEVIAALVWCTVQDIRIQLCDDVLSTRVCSVK